MSSGGFGGGGNSDGRDELQTGPRPGVFVSHASEDAPLAEAFRELIQDVSAGLIPTFSSSARDPAAGIPYGDDWFGWIEARIRESGNVVALITPASIGRPWILFEAGFGRAIEGVRVFGLRLGTTGEDAYVGPFKAFQNSGSDPDDLVKLCRQLFDGTPCQPRDGMLQNMAHVFLSKVNDHFETSKANPKQADPESEAFYKALEEMKALVQSRPMYDREGEELRLLDLDHIVHSAMSRGRLVDPAIRATLLLGVAQEIGIGWLVPTVEYALSHPVRIDKLLEDSFIRDSMRHRYRRMPFPPDMILGELLSAVREHQERAFRIHRKREPVQDDSILTAEPAEPVASKQVVGTSEP